MARTKIEILKNGPLIVTGELEITDAEGRPVPVEKETVALCRCGQSGNKPFCDGSHRAAGFEA